MFSIHSPFAVPGHFYPTSSAKELSGFCIFRQSMEARLNILGLVPFSVHVLTGTAALMNWNVGETQVSVLFILVKEPHDNVQ